MNEYQVGHRLKMLNPLTGIDEEPRSSRLSKTFSIDPASEGSGRLVVSSSSATHKERTYRGVTYCLALPLGIWRAGPCYGNEERGKGVPPAYGSVINGGAPTPTDYFLFPTVFGASSHSRSVTSSMLARNWNR